MHVLIKCILTDHKSLYIEINPFTASCENAMTLSVPGFPASCGKFPHSSQLNFWSTKSIFNQFSVFLRTLNAPCVCLQYKHPRSIKRVIRSDKPVTLLLLLWSHKCDFGAEPKSRIIATSAVKGKGLRITFLAYRVQWTICGHSRTTVGIIVHPGIVSKQVYLTRTRIIL
jgi:hypothetical protein